MKLLIAFALICTICVLTVQGAPKWGEDHEHEDGDRPHHHHHHHGHHHHHHGRFHHHRHGDCSKHQHPTADNSSEEKGEGKDKSVSSESTEHQQEGTLDAHSIGGIGGGEIDGHNKPIEDASQLSSSSTNAVLEPHALFEEGNLSPAPQQTDELSSSSTNAVLEPHAVFFEEGNLSPAAQQTDPLNDINGLEQSADAGELNAQPTTLTDEVLQGSTGAGADDNDVDLRSG